MECVFVTPSSAMLRNRLHLSLNVPSLAGAGAEMASEVREDWVMVEGPDSTYVDGPPHRGEVLDGGSQDVV